MMELNSSQNMDKLHQLPMLRPLGRSEQLSAVSHELGFFNNVGMSAHYSLLKPTTSPGLQQIIYAALTEAIRKNDILAAIPVDEASPDAYFARLPSIDLGSCVFFKTRTGSTAQDEEDAELDAILQSQHNTDFKSDYGTLPFWRLIVLEDNKKGVCSFTASFIFHHSLGDGATGAIFHTCFHHALNTALSSSSPLEQSSSLLPIPATTTLLPPLEALHPLSLDPNPSSTHQKEGLTEWTANPIHIPVESHYKTLYFAPSSSAAFARRCKDNGISVTAGLSAIMADALFSALPPSITALTGIIPINLRPWLNLGSHPTASKDAMGSFIDAVKVQIRREHYSIASSINNGKDTGRAGMGVGGNAGGLPAALHTAASIKRYLTANPSPTGEPYTSVAEFKSIADVAAVFKSLLDTPRDAAFEISNLGRVWPSSSSSSSTTGRQTSELGEGDAGARQSGVRVGRIVFSRSAVAFGAAVTTSVVTGVDGGLAVGWSWQRGVVEDGFVGQAMGRFREGIEGDGVLGWN